MLCSFASADLRALDGAASVGAGARRFAGWFEVSRASNEKERP